jgi:hypothetical protein
MKKSMGGLFVAGLTLVIATTLHAGSLENQGKTWLDAQKDPPAIDVNGTWSSEFGDLYLTQSAGSRDVNGNGGGYELTGVVSGKRLYLLFSNHHGTVEYCAVESSESDNRLAGSYSDRQTRLRLGMGLCQQKSRAMFMNKK